jgi:D-alanyl-D-alanine carboxypeptidase (penicillin-binding protein 5/6)
MARVFLLLSILTCFALAPLAQPTTKSSLVSAKCAILMDRHTGLVLWQHNPDLEVPMASTTKIMTAMVILDLGADRLQEQVRVSQYAGDTEGSSQFAEGDLVTLGDLFKAALIKSSNEATVAAAEYLCGSEERFVEQMNDKARELGLQHTHFVNPHGLYDPKRGKEHYSTARDLALITRHALTYYPLICETVVLGYPRSVDVYAQPRGRIVLENRNRILNRAVPGVPNSRVDGVKTGYVKESGRCLVSSATLDHWQLIAVVLDSQDTFQDSLALLGYGFRRYAWKTYASQSEAGLRERVAWGAQRDVPVGVQNRLGAPVPRPEFGGSVEDTVVLRGDRLRAPVRQGQEIGTLELHRDGVRIASATAIALATVPVAWWASTLAVVGVIVLALVVIIVVGTLYGTYTKDSRRRRRELAAARRGIDPGGPGDRERGSGDGSRRPR